MEHNKSVFLAWQAPDTRSWHVVGLLSEHQDKFLFNYTKGAYASERFIPFSGMDSLKRTYISQDLFPLFQNRLLSTKRPEYPSFLKWLGLTGDDVSPITVLGRSGGLRGTDQLQMFNRIQMNDDGTYEHIFFAHGLRHLPEGAQERISGLSAHEELYFCPDPQNEYDDMAVIIRAEGPPEIVGYVPRYLASDVTMLLEKDKNDISVCVEALSEDAPANYKLMCKMSGKLSKELAAEIMNRDEFELITENAESLQGVSVG